MSASLRLKTARGSLITASTTTLMRAVGLVGAVFLARLLDPGSFGLMALATVVLQTTSLFSGLGMRATVVHSDLPRPVVAFHAFLVCAVMGGLLSLAVGLNLSALASVLGSPDMVPVLRWMSLIILFDALATVPEALLRKDLLFGRQSLGHALPELLYVVLAVTLAAFGFGLWSLVSAAIIRSLATTVLFWILCPGWDWLKPGLPRADVFRTLLRYGMQVTVTGIFSFIMKTWDNFLVGRVLGSTALGFYNRALYFANLPVTGFERVVGNVLFSSYARLRNDRERLSQAYLLSVRMVSMVTVPAGVGIFVIAPKMVPAVLGEQWLPMIEPLQIFGLMCVIGLFARSTGPLYLATGRPGLNTRIAMLQTVAMVGLSLAVVSRGAVWVAATVTAAQALGLLYNLRLLETVLPGVRAKLPGVLGPLAAASGLMGLAVTLLGAPVRAAVGEEAQLLELLLLVSAGVATYLAALLIFDRGLVLESVRLAREAAGVGRPLGAGR